VDILQMIQDLTGHKWILVAIAVLGWLSAAVSTTSKLPINISDRYRPLFVILVAEAYAIIVDKQQTGEAWGVAIWQGLLTACATMGLFEVAVTATFGGKLPKWMAWLALIDPKLAEAKVEGTLVPGPVLGGHSSIRPPPPTSTVSTLPPPPPPPPPPTTMTEVK
jgi:hypothetical protein